MAEDSARAWELMEQIGFCMLASLDGEDIRSRPMMAHADRSEHAIYFLTDVEGHKDEEVARNPHVNLAFADSGSHKYLSVSGSATVSNDREKVRELWATPAKAWWDDPDDPAIRVLKVVPKDAQYWEGAGSLASYVKLLAAAVSDSRPDMGKNVKVDL
ncbi:MAG TPA: pyridoxamine 5'-phosphate oxidase family protein [Kiloniellales bacterium]|nr:pyridoxamine 5'-phosphate oxidase family protein [Kiloniellales bacterium]